MVVGILSGDNVFKKAVLKQVWKLCGVTYYTKFDPKDV